MTFLDVISVKGWCAKISERFTKENFMNNITFNVFVIWYTLLNIGLVGYGVYKFRNFKNIDGSLNWGILFARGPGQVLNFVSAFVLAPMLRL